MVPHTHADCLLSCRQVASHLSTCLSEQIEDRQPTEHTRRSKQSVTVATPNTPQQQLLLPLTLLLLQRSLLSDAAIGVLLIDLRNESLHVARINRTSNSKNNSSGNTNYQHATCHMQREQPLLFVMLHKSTHLQQSPLLFLCLNCILHAHRCTHRDNVALTYVASKVLLLLLLMAKVLHMLVAHFTPLLQHIFGACALSCALC